MMYQERCGRGTSGYYGMHERPNTDPAKVKKLSDGIPMG